MQNMPKIEISRIGQSNDGFYTYKIYNTPNIGISRLLLEDGYYNLDIKPIDYRHTICIKWIRGIKPIFRTFKKANLILIRS